jgi:hypothetical protein
MRLDLGTFTGFGYTTTAKGNKTERLDDYSTFGFSGVIKGTPQFSITFVFHIF